MQIKTLNDKREHKKLGLFFIISLIMFASYSILCVQNYSVDSYLFIYGNDIWAPLSSGRVVWALLLKLFDSLGVNMVEKQEYFVILFILSCSWCAYRLVVNLKPDFSLIQGIVLSVPVLLGFINPHMQEWFLFPESTLYYAVGIFCAVEGAILLMKGRYLLSLLLVAVAVLCYQVILSIFVVCALFLSFVRYPDKGISRYCAALVIGGFGGVLSILAQKYTVILMGIQTSRSSELSISSILEKLPVVGEKMLAVFLDEQGLIPRWILPAVVLIAVVLIFKNIFANEAMKKIRFLSVLQVVAALVISVGIVVAPLLLTDAVWFAPRMLVGFLIFAAMLAASAMTLEKTRLANILMVAAALLLMANMYANCRIASDRFQNNALDQYECNIAESYIDKYEAKTGNVIDSVAFYTDDFVAWEHSGLVDGFYDTNIRQLCVDWGRSALINNVIDPSINRVETSGEVYAQYFEGKSWDGFMPDEQLVFIDNTLHWCIY